MDYTTGNEPPQRKDDEEDDDTNQDPADKLQESARLARKWDTELTASKKWMEKFHIQARKCEKAFFDDGDAVNAYGQFNNSRVNLFWSNVQVILAAIYGRLPKAEVQRKFKDYQDDVARVASEIMQRVLNGDIEREWDDTNAAMRDAVQDRFVSGLGQVWCRYDVDTDMVDVPVIDPVSGQPVIDPMTGQPQMQQQERIIDEEAETDYVYWEDFRYSPCRRWRDCRWVARRVYMSTSKLRRRFNLDDKQLAMIPMVGRTPTDDGGMQSDVLKATPFKQAAVWEIWDRDSFTACWYVQGCSFVLDYQDDPLELEDFFPCPEPITATTLTKAFLPKPDYAMAQDLYTELDRINNKLARLQEAIKAIGTYDKNAAGLKNLLGSQVENQMIPVENWSAFVEKGGLNGVTNFLPIDPYVNAIVQLNQRKSQLQADLYELLGISDIMRGASVASETATAQQLKVAYGGARLSNLQNEVARFVSEISRIRANIIANHFQPQTLIARSLIDKTPDAPLAQPAIAMLKQFGLAMHAIKVDADSMSAPDWQQEKETRTEFMGAVSNYLMAAGPVMQQNPIAGIALLKMLQWGAAGFKGSSTIEGVLDQAVSQLEAQARQPQTPPPPPPDVQAKAAKDAASAKKYSAEADRTSAETAIMAPYVPAPPPMAPMGMPGGLPITHPGSGRPGMASMPGAGPGPGPTGMGLPANPMPPAPQ